MIDHDRGSRVASACGFEVGVLGIESLGGGCTADVRRITFEDGRSVVAKFSDRHERLEEESHSLARLAETNTVRVPMVLGLGPGVLVIEYLPPTEVCSDSWPVFGGRLADLHQVEVGDRYGLERNNHLGETAQINTFHDDWVEFNRICRIGPLRDRISRLADADDRELAAIDRLMDALPDLLPSRPRPSLLHGDLWSGNAHCTEEGEIAVIDPAVSVGDGLADLAMMQLFGGFPGTCFEAYFDRAGPMIGTENQEERLAVYRLYHVLNHRLLFGRGYSGQAMAIIDDLLR